LPRDLPHVFFQRSPSGWKAFSAERVIRKGGLPIVHGEGRTMAEAFQDLELAEGGCEDLRTTIGVDYPDQSMLSEPLGEKELAEVLMDLGIPHEH
jgi:hypothetical protein